MKAHSIWFVNRLQGNNSYLMSGTWYFSCRFAHPFDRHVGPDLLTSHTPHTLCQSCSSSVQRCTTARLHQRDQRVPHLLTQDANHARPGGPRHERRQTVSGVSFAPFHYSRFSTSRCEVCAVPLFSPPVSALVNSVFLSFILQIQHLLI